MKKHGCDIERDDAGSMAENTMEEQERLARIRQAEAQSHRAAYESFSLYEPGSWLARPVRTVLELLPLFEGYREFQGLDLGCGVGRNAIAVARAFGEIPCRVDCVDILELAIERLEENARKFHVENAIRGIVAGIDEFVIPEGEYDLILAVSALEHGDSREGFIKKLEEMRGGVRENGAVCLIVNTGVTERDKLTWEPMPAQFEVNFPTAELNKILPEIFKGWQKIKHTVAHQCYDIPRESRIAALETDVVTYVARKKEGQNG